ncbi:deleted in malignant brain tumors 1 protein-like [Ylistrum balloti]|uniref:deleted in malignant brain tumors 1 protein-like n=1 Tax=Ylistrum balloti TaxID=509963 RepID=UPI0029058EDC|nr:deleted in malignant brain tumors 1 protein-like [Ylistrum balloti]
MEGRVEIRYNNKWLSVCDHTWADQDATAVCNLLSTYPLSRQVKGIAQRHSLYGHGTGQLVTAHFPCNADGYNTDDCFKQWQFDADCDHRNNAGVSCKAHMHMTLGSHRPASGFGPEGTLQMQFENNNFTICDSGFDTYDASAVCRNLGYWSTSPTTFYDAWFGEGTGTALRLNPLCSGNEANIAFCQDTNLWASQTCSHVNDVGINCAPAALGRNRVRLVNGENPGTGRLEVFYNGHWGAFCWEHWDQSNAAPVCKTLRYSTVNPKGFQIQRNQTSMTVGQLHCHGYESDIGMCSADLDKTGCGDTAVGIDCSDGVNVRLVGGPSDISGRVEIADEGFVGALSIHRSIFGHNEAIVLCRTMGYRDTTPQILHDTHGRTDGYNAVLGELKCGGWEDHIKQCSFTQTRGISPDVAFVSCFNCSSVSIEPSGEMSSPNYPSAYTDNADCLYIIKPQDDTRLYQLQIEDLSMADSGDYIEIRESPNGQILGNYSTSGHLPILAGKAFWIRFRTNSYGHSTGFRITWRELTFNDTMTTSCIGNDWTVHVNITLALLLRPNITVSSIILTEANTCKGHVISDEVVFSKAYPGCNTSNRSRSGRLREITGREDRHICLDRKGKSHSPLPPGSGQTKVRSSSCQRTVNRRLNNIQLRSTTPATRTSPVERQQAKLQWARGYWT